MVAQYASAQGKYSKNVESNLRSHGTENNVIASPNELIHETFSRKIRSKKHNKKPKKSKSLRYLAAERANGSNCIYEGQEYDNGALFKPKPCNICNCNDGLVECQEITCDVLQCENQSIPEGACCPVCNMPVVDIGRCQTTISVY